MDAALVGSLSVLAATLLVRALGTGTVIGTALALSSAFTVLGGALLVITLVGLIAALVLVDTLTVLGTSLTSTSLVGTLSADLGTTLASRAPPATTTDVTTTTAAAPPTSLGAGLFCCLHELGLLGCFGFGLGKELLLKVHAHLLLLLNTLVARGLELLASGMGGR